MIKFYHFFHKNLFKFQQIKIFMYRDKSFFPLNYETFPNYEYSLLVP